jgi:hypothetical protein
MGGAMASAVAPEAYKVEEMKTFIPYTSPQGKTLHFYLIIIHNEDFQLFKSTQHQRIAKD